MLALALTAAAPAAGGAAVHRPSTASTWKLPSSLAPCTSRCSLQRRLLALQLKRAEGTAARHASARRKAQAAPDDETASGIEGIVTDAATKTGLTGIEVCAYERTALEEGAYEEEEVEPACGTVVEETGRYQLGIPPGEYVVQFLDPARVYVTQYYQGHTILEESNLVTVKAKTFRAKVNAAMVVGGKIGGAVTAAAGGAPLEGLLACAVGVTTGANFGCAETGSGGSYQIKALASGTYEVFFLVPPLPGFNYLDAPVAGVKVLAGATTSGVNSALPAGGEIEGKVTSLPGGAPLANVIVCAFSGPEEEELEECAHTAADGTYAVERLPTGSYYVEFFDPEFPPQFYPGKGKLSDATPVAVTAGKPPVTGIDAQFGEETVHGGSIAGHVTSAATKSALPGVEVCAIAPPAERVECDVSAGDGSYALEDLPEGSYAVEFHDSPAYVKQYYAGKATLAEATPVTVAGAVNGIDAAMAPVAVNEPVGSIEGHVTAQATGAPVADVLVCAIPLSEGVEEECELDEADGSYQLDELPAGDYKVEFFDPPGYLIQYYDEKSSLAEATTIPVAGGARVGNIDGRLRTPPAEKPGPEVRPPGGMTSPPVTTTRSGTTPPLSGGGGVLANQASVPSLAAGGRVHVAGHRASVNLHCTVGPCHGSLQLAVRVTRRHRVHGRTVTRHVTLIVGAGTFSLAQGASAKAIISLTSQGRRLLATAARHPRAGKLKLTLQGANASLRAVTIA